MLELKEPKRHSPGSLPISQMLPGVHRVRRRTDASVTEYWYAWRGGPQILRAAAKTDALLQQELARLAPQAIATYAQQQRRPRRDDAFLYGLLTRYLESAEFARAAERTRRDRRKFLDKAREELGTMELRALEARGARAALIAWRDRYSNTPKTADELLGALSTVLQWAADRGEILANPLTHFPRLYRANRAEVIWEPHHLALLLPHCAPELAHAVRLAALSGLRLGDLIRLPWEAIGRHAIVWHTGKSRGRRTVVIPVYDELQELFTQIPRRDSPTVLNSARERPWKEPGLESAFRRARMDATARAVEAAGDAEAKSGIEHLRFHDLRGTAATNFIRAGLDLADVATVLGWAKGKVEQIAARYVTAEEIGRAMVEKLRRARLAAEAMEGSDAS